MHSEDLDFLIKNGKRSNIINGIVFETIINMSYWFVKVELPKLLSLGNVANIIDACFKETGQKNKSATKVNEAMSFVLWIRDEIESIHKLETEYLSSPPDMDMLAAGIKDLDELGEINIIDSLAGGDILKWEAVKKLPYYMVFDKQRKTMLEGKINKRLSEVLRSKNKTKR